ncbi:unnamed protein product [Symbiodinium natans]|uniref:Uncharacterized protein n=1 Tax=Symbiodinium natans TaxID=878477 RepID=A0A812QGX3_9DINO|nr:unnamed protein product [Symbiodinium natans]
MRSCSFLRCSAASQLGFLSLSVSSACQAQSLVVCKHQLAIVQTHHPSSRAMALALLLALASLVQFAATRRMQREEEVDCSQKLPAPENFQLTPSSYDGLDGVGVYWQTAVPLQDCEKYFMYFKKYDRFVALQRMQALNRVQVYNICAAEATQYGDVAFCQAEKEGPVWDSMQKFVSTKVEECKSTLCSLARTGEWKAGMFKYKQDRAKKTPWRRELPGHESLGFEEAFNVKCGLYRVQVPKSFAEVVPTFQDFADKYGFISPKGTFNKTACGCPSEDECD